MLQATDRTVIAIQRLLCSLESLPLLAEYQDLCLAHLELDLVGSALFYCVCCDTF